MLPATENEARYMLDMFKARHGGYFPQAYAEAELAAHNQLPPPREFYVAVGTALADALQRRRAISSKRIWRLRARLLKGRKGSNYAHAIETTANALNHLATRRARAEQQRSDPDARLARAFGAFLFLAAACRSHGVYAENEALAARVSAALRGEGISATDVLRAVREFTRFVPLAEWTRTRLAVDNCAL